MKLSGLAIMTFIIDIKIPTHLQYFSATLLFLQIFLLHTSHQGHPIPYALSPVYLQYLEDVEVHLYNLLKDNALEGVDANDRSLVQR